MRFPRQARIFRGPLDAAPVAGVFFLLIIFLLVRSVLFTPGVLVQTGAGPAISVARNGEIRFAGTTYTEKDLDQLRQAVKSTDPKNPLVLQADPDAPAELVSRLNEVLRIEPPQADHFVGTENPTAMVAINLRGQFFFESRMVSEVELKAQLQNSLKKARSEAKDLTLVLLEDGAVESKVLVRLCSLAREVGIREVLVATRPAAFSPARVGTAQ